MKNFNCHYGSKRRELAQHAPSRRLRAFAHTFTPTQLNNHVVRSARAQLWHNNLESIFFWRYLREGGSKSKYPHLPTLVIETTLVQERSRAASDPLSYNYTDPRHTTRLRRYRPDAWLDIISGVNTCVMRSLSGWGQRVWTDEVRSEWNVIRPKATLYRA